MGLSSRAILDIIELVYYGPALLLTLLIIKKHGMGRQSGWIYLAILAVIRIVGAATGIAANSHSSRGLIETSDIAYSVGISPLFLAWLGIIKRVNEGMHVHSFPPRLIDIVHLPIIAGLILAIIGGTDLYSTSPATVNDGVTDTKVAVMIFLLAFLALSIISVFTFTRIHQIMDGEKRLVFASVAVIPFLLVRIIYAIIVDFSHGSTVFSLTSDRHVAVVVQAIMSVAMEFIAVLIFIIAGFATPAIPRSMVRSGDDITAPVQQPATAYSLGGTTISYAGRKEGQEDGVIGSNSGVN